MNLRVEKNSREQLMSVSAYCYAADSGMSWAVETQEDVIDAAVYAVNARYGYDDGSFDVDVPPKKPITVQVDCFGNTYSVTFCTNGDYSIEVN